MSHPTVLAALGGQVVAIAMLACGICFGRSRRRDPLGAHVALNLGATVRT